jgi:hypothetical protein
MLGKIAKWLFLTPVALVWGGWLLFEKHVGKNTKIWSVFHGCWGV